MEYSIYLNQARCIDWQLTYPEAILCSYYANEHNWVRTKIIDVDGDYFCIAISKLIKDLPIIGSSKSFFSKTLNSLVEKGLFEKIVDEDNSKTVFYRFLPAAKVWWKYPEVSLATDIKKRSLLITNVFKELQVLLNDNTIIKCEQLFSIENDVLSNENIVFSIENEVLSNENLSYNYNHNTNHITTNHNIENDDDSLKVKNNTKENILKTEFEKLILEYPTTVNNSPKTLALAFGSYSKLTQTQRVDLFKAVRNYAKTKQVKDHQKKATTNFIQSLNNFITKSFTDFLYGLPENYTFEEEFKVPQKPNGAQVEVLADFQVEINGVFVSAINELNKFKAAKKILEQDNFISANAENYDDSKIKVLFDELEWKKIQMRGGVAAINQHEAPALTETLLEDIAKENN